jgi:sigma-E factor negative regulatory protein RseC
MMTQQARVVACNAKTVTLATENAQGCHSCSVQGTCGSGLMAKLFPKRFARHLCLPRKLFPENIQLADTVLLGILEKNIQAAVWLLYATPLLGLLFGSLFGSQLAKLLGQQAFTEPASIVGGLLGLLIASLYVHKRVASKNLAAEQHLKVLQVKNSTKSVTVPFN